MQFDYYGLTDRFRLYWDGLSPSKEYNQDSKVRSYDIYDLNYVTLERLGYGGRHTRHTPFANFL